MLGAWDGHDGVRSELTTPLHNTCALRHTQEVAALTFCGYR